MLHGKSIAVHAEAADNAQTGAGDIGMVAEGLALVDVGDMDLYDGGAQRADAVLQGYTGVGIRPGIQHDAIVVEAYLLHLVYQRALYIALIIVYLHVGIALAQRFEIGFKGAAAVNTGFAGSQEIQVGTIDNLYLHLSFGD